MVQLVKRASDVRIQEINLSAIIIATSTAVAAIPIISKQGSTVPLLFTNKTDFNDEYGNSNPSVSMTIQSGENFLTEGNQLWGLRVVGDGALYAGVMLLQTQTGTITLRGMSATNPKNTDLSTLVAPTEDAIALFYPSRGPGSYGDDLSIQIGADTIDAPASINASSSATGGMLPSATYQYAVSALSAAGESLATNPVTVVVSGTSQATSSITLTWALVPGAIGYKVYGRVAGSSYGFMSTIGAATGTFTDTGLISPDHSKQPITDASQAAASEYFTVSVYDNTNLQQGPLEQWSCTLGFNVDASGTQTQLEDRINPFSNYIQVASNVPALTSLPEITNVARTSMAGGDSGSAPTTYQIANALQVFTNKQLYPTNIFINAGLADPVMQLSLDTLVQGRGDAVALLDVPAASQQFQAAIDYRNLTLNLNSSYSALFTPDLLQADLVNGMQVYAPPSGWAAALCARTDRVANPAYSIAGLNRGLLNVLKARYQYDDGQATAMFTAQVNYSRTFVGQGIALWEQQTLSGQYSALSWLSVRRITNVIKVALYQFLLYALQEMPTDAVRRSIVNSCTSYLNTIVASSGLYSFQVVCNNSNNTPDTANAGVLVVSVILVPMIPIHEIQLQVIISKQGVSFSEVLSQVNGNSK